MAALAEPLNGLRGSRQAWASWLYRLSSKNGSSRHSSNWMLPPCRSRSSTSTPNASFPNITEIRSIGSSSHRPKWRAFQSLARTRSSTSTAPSESGSPHPRKAHGSTSRSGRIPGSGNVASRRKGDGSSHLLSGPRSLRGRKLIYCESGRIGPYFLDFSTDRTTMHLKIEKIWPRFPAFSLRSFLPRRLLVVVDVRWARVSGLGTVTCMGLPVSAASASSLCALCGYPLSSPLLPLLPLAPLPPLHVTSGYVTWRKLCNCPRSRTCNSWSSTA